MSILDTMATTARVRPLLWLAEAPASPATCSRSRWRGRATPTAAGTSCSAAASTTSSGSPATWRCPDRDYRRGNALTTGIVYARGSWMDEVRVELFAGLPAEPPVSWPTDVDSELLAANPDPVDDVIVEDVLP